MKTKVESEWQDLNRHTVMLLIEAGYIIRSQIKNAYYGGKLKTLRGFGPVRVDEVGQWLERMKV